MNTEIQLVLQQLPRYLSDNGIDPTQHFCCPHPDHDDSSPSACVYKDTIVKCFGCGRNMHIFDVASYFEGLPGRGDNGYYQFNVSELAKRYGVVLPVWSSSPILDIHTSVVEYITKVFAKQEAERLDKSIENVIAGWAPHAELVELQKKLPVCLRTPDLDDLISYLIDKGFDSLHIKLAGINDKIFPDTSSVIYPLWHGHGVCLGFMTRQPNGVPKYINTANNACFTKGKYLYGLFLRPDPKKPIYIVEGQKDALAVWSKKQQALGLLGTALTKDHLETIIKEGFTRVVLALDADSAGTNSTVKAIEEFLKLGIIADVCELPEGSDPYQYLLEDEHRLMPEAKSGLELYIKYITTQCGGDKLAASEYLTRIIACATSSIRQELIGEQVASLMGLSKSALLADIEYNKRVQESNLNQNTIKILESALDKARHEPGYASQIMNEAVGYIESLSINTTAYTNDFSMDLIEGLESGKSNRADLDIHFRPGGLKNLSDLLHEGGLGWTGRRMFAVGGDPHTGKCHGRGTKVFLFDGSIKAIEDIVPGDQLMGPDSKPRNVLSICRGREEMFEVIPSYGESWECNRSHILALECNRHKTPGFKKGEQYNISVDDYLKLTDTQKHGLKLYRVAVDFEEQAVPYDPYFIGLWMGDGTKNDTQITTMDKEVIEYLHSFAELNRCYITKQEDKRSKADGYRVIGVRGCSRNNLRRYVMSLAETGEKRIPKEYLVNSKENRNLLLAGLIDSDGYNNQGTGYEIVTKYEGLREDILYLARTLGHRATWSIKHVDDVPYYRIYITGFLHEIPVKIEKKKIKEKSDKGIRHPLRTGFRLESKGEGDYYGVTLDGDRLYLLWDCTVTHNTAILLQLCAEVLCSSTNSMVIHFSTDDASEVHLPRIIAATAFSPEFFISYAGNNNLYGAVKEARNKVMNKVSGWIRDERLILKDQNFGTTLRELGGLVKFYRDKYPHRRIIVINDNLHRNQDYPTRDDNSRREAIANDAKTLAVKEDVAFWCTVEYRKNKAKGDGMASNSDIAGDRALQYHLDFIMNLYNDYIEQNNNLSKCIYVHKHDGKMFPRVVANVSKNKVTGVTKALYYDMFPLNSFCREADAVKVREELASRKEMLTEQGLIGGYNKSYNNYRR